MPSTYNSATPLGFAPVSMVTATLGDNDPSLGTRQTVDGNEYVFAYNDCNSQIDPGYGCVLQSGASGMSVTVTAATSADAVVGVVKHATFTTGTYGWLLTRGFGTAEMHATSGSVSVNGLIEIGAAGVFAPVSLTTGNKAPAVGKALEAIVSGASGSVYFFCN